MTDLDKKLSGIWLRKPQVAVVYRTSKRYDVSARHPFIVEASHRSVGFA